MPSAPSAPPPAVVPSSTPVVTPDKAAARAATLPATNVSEMGRSATTLAPPKPGSARERLLKNLEKTASGAAPQTPISARHPANAQRVRAATPDPSHSPAPAPQADPAPKTPEIEEPGIEPEPAEAPEVQPEPESQPEPSAAVTDKKGKVSPWKLLDQFKERAAKAEARALDLEKNLLPEGDRKAVTERLTKAEARTKELEDEIRYVNYSKSQEYVEKYQKPYEDAWARATSELNEIPVTDPNTQETRAATTQDLLTLVNLPLGKAREIADQVFGPFADDVMSHRKEIKNLFETQQKALEDAKTNGGEREKQRLEEITRTQKELLTSIKQTWDKVNSEMLTNDKFATYFKPREGDEDWNQRLQKGFALADRAFTENPNNPKLSPEERVAIIKRHAAVRNRAASWGAIRMENEKLKNELAEAKKELAKYSETTPETGGREPSPAPSNGGTARSRMFSALEKIARPL